MPLTEFQEGEDILASETNDNNKYLESLIKDSIEKIEKEIDQNFNTLNEKISSSLPIGSVALWTSTNIPVGWLAMVGQSISNEAYADLRTVIGTTTLPDTRNRVPQGNATPLNTIAAGLPNHNHFVATYTTVNVGKTNLNASSYVSAENQASSNGWAAYSMGATANVANVGLSSGAMGSYYGASGTVQPPAVTFVFIIKYQ